MRLLQGMTWSGPLLYSQASSSAVIMVLSLWSHDNIDSVSAHSRARDSTAHTGCLPAAGSARLAPSPGHRSQITTVVILRWSTLTRLGYLHWSLRVECCPWSLVTLTSSSRQCEPSVIINCPPSPRFRMVQRVRVYAWKIKQSVIIFGHTGQNIY